MRLIAAWALGEIGDNRAVEALREAQKDEDWQVKSYVTEALDKIEYQVNKY